MDLIGLVSSSTTSVGASGSLEKSEVPAVKLIFLPIFLAAFKKPIISVMPPRILVLAGVMSAISQNLS